MKCLSVNNLNFKSNLHPLDVKYKKALISGIASKFQFTPKLENLNSILSPSELKEILKKVHPKHFYLGKAGFYTPKEDFDIQPLINGGHRINLHIHTQHSDGSMSVDQYLEQSKAYSDKVAQKIHNDSIPAYISSITDHNNVDGVQEAIARIAEEPKKYKNFKFVPGCEFMFNDPDSEFEFSAFEAVGLGFNPFDEEIVTKLSKFAPINLIQKIKEFGGILSYAHPIRFCQGNGIAPNFIEYLKKIGINGIESNYQYLNIKKTEEVIEMIKKAKIVAKQNKFWETGGTDTHTRNIFHFTIGEYLDKIL